MYRRFLIILQNPMSRVLRGTEFPRQSYGTVNVEYFTEAEVEDQVRRLKPKQTMRTDYESSCIIRDCAVLVTVPLSIVFNLPVTSQQLLMMRKKSHNISGSQSKVTNQKYSIIRQCLFHPSSVKYLKCSLIAHLSGT